MNISPWFLALFTHSQADMETKVAKLEGACLQLVEEVAEKEFGKLTSM
jgi:hypothetical protein